MTRAYRNAIWLLVPLAALLVNPTWAAVEYRSVPELTVQAQQIVIGDVTELTSYWDDNNATIKSRIVVSVSQYLFGTGSGTEVLVMTGGTVGDVSMRASVLPTFDVGDHVLLFLGNPEIGLVQCFQGAYLTDGRLVVRMGPACQRTIPETYRPLPELLAEIAQALPSGVVLPEILPYHGNFQFPESGRYSLCGVDWTYMAHPMGENYKINANCADSSAGDAASQIAQIQNGTAAWNDAGANFSFTYGGTSTQTAVAFNGTNLVYFDTTPPDGGDYVACTYYWTSGANITEVNLVFNDADYSWWNGSGVCSNDMDIWDVATHEFGHWLCLADLYGSGDTAKTMYGYVSTCDTQKRTLATDDINGIVAIYGSSGGGDTTPPDPNPMTWSTVPYPTSTTSVAMQATTAVDADSPPVEYYFDFVSGGSGGADSGWQSGRVYINDSLVANTSYSYRAKARDSAPTPNETGYSSTDATATFIQTPTGVTCGTPTIDTMPLTADGTFTNLTTGSSGLYFDSTTTGGDGGINVWVQTTTDTATGLAANTLYAFRAMARNQNSVQTSYSGASSKATLIETPTGVSFGTTTLNSIDLTASGTFTNLTTGSSGLYFDSTTAGGDGGINAWVQATTDSATGLAANTMYTFQVKVRNQSSTETAYGPTASHATLIETPTGVSFGTVTESSIVLNASGTLTNLTVGSSGVYFDSTTTGGDGGINAWVQTATDTATGLSPNTQYTFQVKARNQSAVETAYSATASKYTLANLPGAPVLSNVAKTTLQLDVDPNGNPAATPFALLCSATTDATWNGKYVDATGNPSNSPVWRTDVAWSNMTILNLDPATQYCFEVAALNGDGVQTAFSAPSCATTQADVVRGDLNCDGLINGFDIDPFVLCLTSAPSFTDYYAQYPTCNPLNADINCDGLVNAFDIDSFVQCVVGGCPACP